MENLPYELALWVVSVIQHWHGWISGGLLAGALEVGEKLNWWKVSKKVFVVLVLALGFLVSIFAAWQDEHRSNLAWQEKLQPHLEIDIADVMASYSSDSNETMLLIGMRIKNSGADSAAFGYKVHYRSDTVDQEPKVQYLVNGLTLAFSDGITFTMQGPEAINMRSDKPIQRGGSFVGRLPVKIVGNVSKEVSDGQYDLSVTVTDYLGRESSGLSNRHEHLGGTAPMFLPGDPASIKVNN
jgi:hypothetical protein